MFQDSAKFSASKSSFNQQSANVNILLELLRVAPMYAQSLTKHVIDSSPIHQKAVIIEDIEAQEAQLKQAQEAALANGQTPT